VSFDWMQTSTAPKRRSADAESGVETFRSELRERAGMFYRLGFPPSRAIARLVANTRWEFEIGVAGRPKGLSDGDIKEIVKSTYLRRPNR